MTYPVPFFELSTSGKRPLDKRRHTVAGTSSCQARIGRAPLSLLHLLALQPQHYCDITWISVYQELLNKTSYQTFENLSGSEVLLKTTAFKCRYMRKDSHVSLNSCWHVSTTFCILLSHPSYLCYAILDFANILIIESLYSQMLLTRVFL